MLSSHDESIPKYGTQLKVIFASSRQLILRTKWASQDGVRSWADDGPDVHLQLLLRDTTTCSITHCDVQGIIETCLQEQNGNIRR
jgi:hypothetical protein